MPSIAPLAPDQIADLYGATNEYVGTGDGVNKDFQLDYRPIVVGRLAQDEFVGVGDGIQTNYQLQYYPVTAGTMKLYRTAVATANLLTETTHYTVTLATGALVLTPAGVTFLGTEQLHGAYSVPSTLELHKVSISGPALVLGTDYAVVAYSGKITLTVAGVAALGTDALYAKYKTTIGLVNVLEESNASLRGTLAQNVVLLEKFTRKDDDVRYICEQIGSLAVLPVERERRYSYNAYAIMNVPPYLFPESGNYILASEEVTEPLIVASVSTPYTDTAANAPLYFRPSVASEIPGDPANLRQPDGGKPRFAVGLTSGTGSDTNTLERWLARELTRIPLVQAAGFNNPGPLGWDARFNEASNPYGILGGMITSMNNEMTLLGTQVIPALTDFVNNNSPSNEYVTATDITNAQAALLAAQNFYNDTYNYLNNEVIPAPHGGHLPEIGLSDGGLATRTATIAAYQTFLANVRKPQIGTLLAASPSGLYPKRFFWVTMRASMGTGTLFNVINTQRGSTKAQAQIPENDAKIAEVMLVINAQ